jgi:hypothetical protein
MLRGDNGIWLRELHLRFNSRAVVVGPNLVSVYGPNAARSVYGTVPQNVLRKDQEIAHVIYTLGGGTGWNLPSINDGKTAVARRRVYGPLFSPTNLHQNFFRHIAVFLERLRGSVRETCIDCASRTEGSSFEMDIMQPLRSTALYSIATIVFGDIFVDKYFEDSELDSQIPEAVDSFLADGLLEFILGPFHVLACSFLFRRFWFRSGNVELGSAKRLRAVSVTPSLVKRCS